MQITHIAIIPFLDEVLEVAAELKPQWNALSAEIPSWHLRMEGDDDADADANADADGDDADDNDDNDDADDDDAGSGDDDKDLVQVPRAEINALRAAQAKQRRKEQKEKREKQQSERRKKAQEGKYEELLAEKDDEIAELQEKIAGLTGELTTTRAKGLIASVAKRLNFDDTDIAKALFSEYQKDGEEQTNESDVEAVLKRILRAKPKLKANAKATGGPTGGSNGNGKISYEDIAKMSQEEVSKRWNDADFQAALEAGPAT